MGTIRAFIALDFDQMSIDNLQTLFAEAKRLSSRVEGAKFKFVNHFHITLQFLGDIEESKLPSIKTILSSLQGQFKPIQVKELNAKSIDFFYKFDNVYSGEKVPTVLMLKTESAELDILAEQLFLKINKVLTTNSEKDFKQHITFARISYLPDALKHFKELNERLTQLKSKLPNTGMLKLRPSKITLYKSDLTLQGPVYEELFSVPSTESFYAERLNKLK